MVAGLRVRGRTCGLRDAVSPSGGQQWAKGRTEGLKQSSL